ncbi:hypothetical protein EX30DRAFT_343624 [Ascodesmis nigricans]|uniref:Peptidase S1 domain-containing protein n=1 Tax=Ascodesmis nigricans TaxID=341454 RepID=A0A4S2MLW6_9PEZI|nr:hypothetical protein EX30DRAFT_343624 [Ascodesmis nigricans]
MDIAPHSRGVKLMSPTWATELLQREKAEFKLEEAKRSLNTYLENCAARRLQPIHLHAFNVEVERYIKRLAGGPEDAVFGKVAVDCCNLHTIRWHNRTTSVDWSLVEVTPGIRCSNTIVDDDLGIEFADSTLTIKTFHSQGNLKHKRIEVWKKGMKTKLTHDRLNGTISRVQFETMDGQENLEATEELAVVAIGEGDLFSAPGDSGSWVFDQEGALIGMVLGGNEGNGASYISDAQMIRREICKIVDREPDIAQFRL